MDKDLQRKVAVDFFHKLIDAMETELALPKGILVGLLDQSDWELVIKAAVIVEVALGDAIQRVLTAEEIASTGQKIWQGLGPKIRVAYSNGILTNGQRDQLTEISRMRNICAHDRSGLSFTFKRYLDVPKQSASFTRNLGKLVSADEYRASPLGTEAFISPAAAVLGRVAQISASLLLARPRDKAH